MSYPRPRSYGEALEMGYGEPLPMESRRSSAPLPFGLEGGPGVLGPPRLYPGGMKGFLDVLDLVYEERPYATEDISPLPDMPEGEAFRRVWRAVLGPPPQERVTTPRYEDLPAGYVNRQEAIRQAGREADVTGRRQYAGTTWGEFVHPSGLVEGPKGQVRKGLMAEYLGISDRVGDLLRRQQDLLKRLKKVSPESNEAAEIMEKIRVNESRINDLATPEELEFIDAFKRGDYAVKEEKRARPVRTRPVTTRPVTTRPARKGMSDLKARALRGYVTKLIGKVPPDELRKALMPLVKRAQAGDERAKWALGPVWGGFVSEGEEVFKRLARAPEKKKEKSGKSVNVFGPLTNRTALTKLAEGLLYGGWEPKDLGVFGKETDQEEEEQEKPGFFARVFGRTDESGKEQKGLSDEEIAKELSRRYNAFVYAARKQRDKKTGMPSDEVIDAVWMDALSKSYKLQTVWRNYVTGDRYGG